VAGASVRTVYDVPTPSVVFGSIVSSAPHP
jgi:hypothetical protein